ncbi:PREDICTED: salicylate/benzoate carboxyl methyltransferase-like [Camelina sativa]|uniref:Salicylate/benzoate carboxyl methyltransferase-like n=1 Tax=Camelina sativa TaxID=90675 RepID=A0ABM0UCV7_CAMSA|nr:PREDICTED: salicylate/benzoate carboxyl methyltransferase-like [Camelina sativa]
MSSPPRNSLMNVVSMKGGNGEHSYATNSGHQKTVFSKAQTMVVENMRETLVNFAFPECIKVAELGCSSGQNTFMAMSEIVKTIITLYQEKYRCPPEIDCCLNDLPMNDFNMTFKWASSFQEKLKMDYNGRCFVSGVPGSFYSRVFPRKSLHFVHSACSIHWLSKVPEGIEDNKKNVYIRSPCPLNVSKGYLDQFQKDFTLFLKVRSEEVMPNGRMVLTFKGRNTSDPLYRESCHYWSLLTDSLLDLVSEGVVKESEVDSFNLPFYDAGEEEVREVVKNEGSFEINKIETHEHLVPYKDSGEADDETCRLKFGEMMANRKRSITEPMLVAHFGDAIIDRLFKKYAHNAAQYYIVSRGCNKTTINFVVSLTRK